MATADISQPISLLRDRAIIVEVLYATGMRRMEIAHLQISDIDIDQCLVLDPRRQGQKRPPPPLGERALHWVQTYLDREPSGNWAGTRSTHLFLSR